MAEPSSTIITTSALASISLFSVVLGVNPDKALGAFAGATLFVTSSQELKIPTRIIYLIISLVMGYYLSGEVLRHTFIQSAAIAGFLSGLTCVSIGLAIVRYLSETDWISRLLMRSRK